MCTPASRPIKNVNVWGGDPVLDKERRRAEATKELAPDQADTHRALALIRMGLDWDFTAAEADVEWLRQMVTALRRIRSELGVSPSKQVPLLVQGGSDEERARLRRFDSQLRFLNRLAGIEAVDGDPPPSAAGLVGELRLFVPLEGLVDLDAERARLDRELARISGEKDKSAAKLAKFSDKVPPAVVQQERQRLEDWTAQHQALAAQRTRLG